jgi:pentatricopeptide repeat protein
VWNSLLSAYAHLGLAKEAIELYHRMQKAGVPPNAVTFACLLIACTEVNDIGLGKYVHSLICNHSLENQAVIATALIHMYAHCGSLDDAKTVFNSMRKNCQNLPVSVWNAMISSYPQLGQPQEAIKLFFQMQSEHVPPDLITFVSVLTACADRCAYDIGKQIHQMIQTSDVDQFQPNLACALLNMYGKCGSMTEVFELFDDLRRRQRANDIVLWNVVILVAGHNGAGKEALELFSQMQHEGLKPNHITFVGVLNACSHSGFVDEAIQYFESMPTEYGITPTLQHYTCLIDALGRGGRLQQAHQLVLQTPNPDIVVWKSLLGACRGQGDVQFAEYAAERALELDDQDSAVYVLLANIYSAAGRKDDAARVRKQMEEKGIKKIPGRTWFELDGEVHTMVSQDRSHPRIEEILAESRQLQREMKQRGYKPDISFVLQDVEEDAKEDLLCQHSEKLAICLLLISTPPKQTLRLAKNLRVCGDCHEATKHISELRDREIIVRDANRFHHFKNGKCSCNDYW